MCSQLLLSNLFGHSLRQYVMMRIVIVSAQGSHIKIRTNSELPVHVDGEPWIQAPGDIVVLKSALKVRRE